MRRLRRGMGIGAALTLLLLGAPVDGASAAPKGPSSGQQGGQGDERQAEAAQQRPRKKPVEPKGNPASPAAMRAGRLSCGDVITKSTTLVADIGPCPADGIVIGADNIFLNLNGHTISGELGPGDGTAAGIRLPGRTGVTITGHPGESGKTGTVTGFDAGVVIRGGSHNVVRNLMLRNNVGPPDFFSAGLGDGLVIFSSSHNRIVNNVAASNRIFSGIGIADPGATNNLVQGNVVENNVGDGLVLFPHANDNRVVGNVVRGNGFETSRRIKGSGLVLNSSARRNIAEQNQVHRNAGHGIFVGFTAPEFQPQGNYIIDNIATENGLVGFPRYYDLFDNNTAPQLCDSNVWRGNTYGDGFPSCTRIGGTRVGSEPPEPPDVPELHEEEEIGLD